MKSATQEVVKSTFAAATKGAVIGTAAGFMSGLATVTTTTFVPKTSLPILSTLCEWTGYGSDVATTTTVVPVLGAFAVGGAVLFGAIAAYLRHRENKKYSKRIADAEAAVAMEKK